MSEDILRAKTDRLEQSSEQLVDFTDYSFICNHLNDGSRSRGVLAEEAYEEVLSDPNTGFITINGRRVPALVDVSQALTLGYDEHRCKELAHGLSPHIKILALPVHELGDDERAQLAGLLSEQKTALYFSDHEGSELSALADILDSTGIGHSEKPLVDDRAAEGDEQASLVLYSCEAIQVPESGERKRLSLADIQGYYDANVEPYRTADGETETTLNMGDRLSDDDAEEMWSVFNDMFNFLGGADHPISMQDSKEDFMGMLRTGDTMISATYKLDGSGNRELVCFTYFIDDMDNLYWLNQDFFRRKSDDEPDYITDIYTPGLVSRGTDRAYSGLSIGFFAKVVDEAGFNTHVLYENTNLSKRYVPRIVDASMKRYCKHMEVIPSKPIDEVTYRLWSIGGEGE